VLARQLGPADLHRLRRLLREREAAAAGPS